MSQFADWASALRFREVAATIVREEVDRQRPAPRFGEVQSFNRFTMTAKVFFPGDVEPTAVKFPMSVQPTKSVELNGTGDIARIEGVPGNLWITEIVSGPVQMDRPRLHQPRLMGGEYLHVTVASFFSYGTSPLPSSNQSWHFGRWVNPYSFAASGLATMEVVVQQTLFCAISKHYLISIRANDTSDAWQKVAADRDSGPWSGNDFELEMRSSSTYVEFRVRRTGVETGGLTPGGYDLNILFHGHEWERDFTVVPAISTDSAPTRFHGVSSTEGKGPFLSPAMSVPHRAQHLLTGGGAVYYDTSLGILKWSARFMTIGIGRNSHYAGGGYYEIGVPTGGVAIPVYNKSGQTATETVAGGIWLGSWDSLYYEVPWGAGVSFVEANLRIVNYDAGNFQVPSHWIHIATHVNDSNFRHVMLGTGENLYLPVNLSLASGFGNLTGSGWAAPAYRGMQGQRVSLEGVVSCTSAKTAGSTITGTAIPAGYRPGAAHNFGALASTGTLVRIDVQATGALVLQTALTSGAWFSLDGMNYPRVQ